MLLYLTYNWLDFESDKFNTFLVIHNDNFYFFDQWNLIQLETGYILGLIDTVVFWIRNINNVLNREKSPKLKTNLKIKSTESLRAGLISVSGIN